MAPREILALAATEVPAHLGGDLAGLGPIESGLYGGRFPDAASAARIVLSDVAQCAERDQAAHGPVSSLDWADLEHLLRRIEQAFHARRSA